jgi:hypothetical protein
LAIDAVRGIALITITINHFTGTVVDLGMAGFKYPTPTERGISSAAEVFFLLSGYLVGAVYLSRTPTIDVGIFATTVWRRAARLYLSNVLLFLTCWLVVAVSPVDLASVTSFLPYLNRPAEGIKVLAMVWHPNFIGILYVYVVLLLFAPIFVLALRASPWVAFATSLLFYCIVQARPEFNIAAGSREEGAWHFNPFAWQFIFYGALLAGRYKLLAQLQALVLRHVAILFGAAILLLASYILVWASRNSAVTGLSFAIPFDDKQSLGISRVVHAVVYVLALLSVFWRFPILLNIWPGRALITIGKGSLEAFLISVVVTYALSAAWLVAAPTTLGYLILCPVSVVLLWVGSVAYQARQASLSKKARAWSASDEVGTDRAAQGGMQSR